MENEIKAGYAWREYIKQFPALDVFWKYLPEPTNTWLSQQIDIFAGKYPVKNDVSNVDSERLAIDFTKEQLKGVNLLLSEGYETGFKEGVEHYIEWQKKQK